MPFLQAMQEYLNYLNVVKNASKHTIRNYTIDIDCLRAFLVDFEKGGESLAIDHIDQALMRRFVSSLYNKQLSKRTIVRRLSSLRSFFAYLGAQGHIASSPLTHIESPKLEKRIPFSLSYQQVQLLFDTPDTNDFLGLRDRCIMELFYSSGLRVSELVALNRTDFNLRELTIKLMGKGEKERLIPITKNAAEWLNHYLTCEKRFEKESHHLPEADENAIFLNRWGTRLSPRSVDRRFDFYLTRAGLAGKVTPHTIRHTIATHWLENGMDIKTIQLLLGHSSPSTTTIYTKVSKGLKRQVYDKTHPRA